MLTRRGFGAATVAGLALPGMMRGLIASEVAGVRLGAQSYSFRAMSPAPGATDMVDTVIGALTACGLNDCELWAPQVEPRLPFGRGDAARQAREELRRWRLETPLDHFEGIRRRFEAAGIALYAYNLSFNDSFSDAEIDRGFEIARALGAEIITASSTLPAARRVAPFAERHRMVVAMHNHSNVSDPDEFATPESLLAATRMSDYFKINLDIGHFTAANNDPVAFLREHFGQVTNLHLKDRARDQGPNTQWGEGDTPIREVLALLRAERWPIRAHIEYEYQGAGTPVEEVTRCFDYVKQALA